MAQYKTVLFDTLEHTEIARKSYQDYERGADQPDESEIEAAWIGDKDKLRRALDVLTPRQREVFIFKVGFNLSEGTIARQLKISQSAVSQFYQAAQKKLRKYDVEQDKQSV